MHIIDDSAEHHFLTCLEKLRQSPAGWFVLHFELSRKLDHENLIADPGNIHEKLLAAKKDAQGFFRNLDELSKALGSGTIYQFADNDIVLLSKIKSAEDEKTLQRIYEQMASKLRGDLSERGKLDTQMYMWQKMADRKFLSVKRMLAYEAMTDANKVASIPIRRKRRDDPMVLIVEDDRFTASYAANILNKEYDLVHVKSGEEAVIAHIEHAPDIVFMDIHLPGLTGHEAVQAIRKVDPEAFVIMLSVDTESANVRSASQNGAQGFLKKPFSKERLLGTVLKSPFVRRGKSGAPGSTYFH